MRYRFADCLLDTDRHLLERAGTAIPVEPQVFDLILLLVQSPGRLVTRGEIVAAVWQGRVVSESAISARIAAARKAVGDDGRAQAVIRTMARPGLQLVAAVTTEGAPAAPGGADGSQRIRYARNRHGPPIAWTATGTGPPLLRVGVEVTDLEAEWQIPVERAIIDAISQQFRFARFDHLGFG